MSSDMRDLLDTLTVHAERPEVRRKAAGTVVANARDKAEALEFLAMTGLDKQATR